MARRQKGRNPFRAGTTLAALYAAVMQLTNDDQMAFVNQLQTVLHDDALVANSDVRRERVAIANLLSAQAEIGDDEELTTKRYRELQATKPDTYRDDRTIRRWLGASTWNEASTRANLNAVPDGDVIVSWNRHSYSLEECIQGIRDFRSDRGASPRSCSDYLTWARRPDVVARDGQRPRSQSPFDNYGGYAAVLIRALGGEPNASNIVGGTTIRTMGYFITETQIRDGLHEVAERLGRSPRVEEYMRERLAISREPDSKGLTRAIPAYATINSRHSQMTWDDTLDYYGLVRLGGPHSGKKTGPKGPKGPSQTKEIVLDALILAYDELGNPFTGAAYTDWRKGKKAEANANGTNCGYPHLSTVRERFGRWEDAVRAMHIEIKLRRPRPAVRKIDL